MIVTERILRGMAIVIAIAGVIDPVFTRAHSDRPLIALIDAGAPVLTERVRTELSGTFIVHPGAIAGAAATVLAGRALPPELPAVSGALIAVTPDPDRARVEIEDAHAPAHAAPGSRIPIDISLRAVGAEKRTLQIDVATGSVVLDRVTHVVTGNDQRFALQLSAPAASTGLMPLTVRVADAASDDPAFQRETTLATEVEPVRWKVLIVDPRPSWASTFVRRALEDDRRFEVASRVSTSRTVATESGSAPALSDTAALDEFSAIVAGAPDALSAADVRALESFARGRGGAVVLLMDSADIGPFASLAGAASFRDLHGVERRTLKSASSAAMVATELAVPQGLTAFAETLASAGSGTAESPAVWQVPVGAGRAIVSGALDSWRYRAREQNGFARFWTAAIADAAAAAPPPVLVMPAMRAIRPDSPLDVRVLIRSAALSDPSRPSPTVDARLRVAPLDADETRPGVVSENDSRSRFTSRLWPSAERGVLTTTMRAPHTPGTYRITTDVVDAAGVSLGSAAADIVVGPVTRVDRDDLAAWTTARGGDVESETRVPGLATRLSDRIHAPARLMSVRPMRSIWWLPLFVAVLGGEWWLRRRRGER
jgi:hypothetical protein